MTKLNQIYKCNICGNIIEILNQANGVLSCCNNEMTLLNENFEEAVIEKHIPVLVQRIENNNKLITITIGEVEHPMEEKHYIQFIELITNDKIYRQILKPNQKPKTKFILNKNEEILKVRGYCNLHGLWKGN